MEYMNMKFNAKPWNAPENCNHGWDGKKFWLTPKGKCVKCSKQIRCCERDFNDDGNCDRHPPKF